MSNSIGNFFTSIQMEGSRMASEASRHMSESVDEVSKANESGGFLFGALTAFDNVSPGNVVAGAVDTVVPGADLPKPLVEGISAGVNIAGGSIPGVGLPLQILALVDGYQALAAMGPGSGAGKGGQRMQTPESPSAALTRGNDAYTHEAREAVLDDARCQARVEIREKAQNNRIEELEARVAHLEELAGIQPGDGYAEGCDDVDVGSGFLSNDFMKGEIGACGKGNSKLDKLERELRDANAEIDHILSNPNLAFEDMVFLLMGAVIKSSEKEIKAGLEQEKAGRALDKSARDGGRAEISALQNQLKGLTTNLAKESDPKKKEELQAKAQNLRTSIEQKQTSLGDKLEDRTESRSERFEALKESLQKISEMQQALSNSMNALHQTAQNAIGNIR